MLFRSQEINYGEIEDADRSSMRLEPLAPAGDSYTILPTAGCDISNLQTHSAPGDQEKKAPVQTLAKFDGEYRSGLGYHQPSGALASVGVDPVDVPGRRVQVRDTKRRLSLGLRPGSCTTSALKITRRLWGQVVFVLWSVSP